MGHMYCEYVHLPNRALCSRYRKHASIFYCLGQNQKWISEEELREANSQRESEAPTLFA